MCQTFTTHFKCSRCNQRSQDNATTHIRCNQPSCNRQFRIQLNPVQEETDGDCLHCGDGDRVDAGVELGTVGIDVGISARVTRGTRSPRRGVLRTAPAGDSFERRLGEARARLQGLTADDLDAEIEAAAARVAIDTERTAMEEQFNQAYVQNGSILAQQEAEIAMLRFQSAGLRDKIEAEILSLDALRDVRSGVQRDIAREERELSNLRQRRRDLRRVIALEREEQLQSIRREHDRFEREREREEEARRYTAGRRSWERWSPMDEPPVRVAWRSGRYRVQSRERHRPLNHRA